MGLISKVNEKLSGNKDTHSVKNVETNHSTATHQAPRLDERTGTSTSTSTSSAPTRSDAYDTRSTTNTNQKHVGTGEKIAHVGEKITHKDLDRDGDIAGKPVAGSTRTSNNATGSTLSGSTSSSIEASSAPRVREHDRTETSTSTSGSRGIECHQGERHAAPIVQTREHDLYEHVDKQRNEEIHHKTHVDQVVQPVYDERREAVQRERVDHGLEVHEHGEKGLTREAEAELARKREEIARAHKNTRDESTTHTNARTAADVERREHRIEEVVPVLERDIYRPHEIVHDKKVVDIYHDGVDGVHTHVNEPVSVTEYERTHGTRLQGSNTVTSSDCTTRDTTTTGSRGGALEHGAERATGRDLNRDGRVGNTNNIVNDTPSAGYTTSGTTHSDAYDTRGSGNTSTTAGGKKHVGLGEKIEHVAEKVTHKDLDHDGDIAGKPKVGAK